MIPLHKVEFNGISKLQSLSCHRSWKNICWKITFRSAIIDTV